MNYILLFLLGLLCVPHIAIIIDGTGDIEDQIICAVFLAILVWAGAVVWGTLL